MSVTVPESIRLSGEARFGPTSVGGRPKLYLLRHPQTGKVAQVIVVDDNGSALDPRWAKDNLKLLVERAPDVIHLAMADEYDVVIV
jgi:hypothetical protein